VSFTELGLRGRLSFLLDISLAGQTLRFATQRLSATIDGSVVEYHPGLVWQRSTAQDFSPWSTQAPSISESFTIYPAEDFDIADVIADGHNPGTATGILRIYSEVDKDAEILIDGVVRDPQWGAVGQPFVLMLEQNPRKDTGVLQTRSQRILKASWANHDTTWNKTSYPIIIGSPSGGDDTYFSGSQAFLVDTANTYVLIAGHHTVAGANGDEVTIANFTQSATDDTAAINGTDDLGQPVTYVDGSLLGTPPIAGDVLWCAWRDDNPFATQTYGLYDDEQTNPLRGAGDVLVYLARLSRGLKWDFARLDAVREDLNQYIIDGPIQPAIGQTITPWDWIQAHILNALPVSMVLGQRGVYIRWWDFTADASDAEITLLERTSNGQGNCGRISLAGSSPLDDVLGGVIVNYAYNHRTTSARESTLLSGNQADVDADEDGVMDPWLKRVGVDYDDEMPTATINLQMIEERSSAVRVASAIAKRGGVQRAVVGYSVDQYPGGLLEPGSVVLVTDDGLGWDKRPGIVQVAEWTEVSTREIIVEVPLEGTGVAA